MNAFQRSAVFAAALVLLAIHAEASAPVLMQASCAQVTPAAATAFYNNFTQICCPNGGVKTLSINSDPYTNCCHDNVASGCPPMAGLSGTDQITCCRPEPARVATDTAVPPVSRNCYSPQFQGCCRAQLNFNDGLNTATSIRVVGDATPFDSETQQCCSTGTSQPIWGGENQNNVAAAVIVPKSISSCIGYLGNIGTTFRCLSDTMCPGYRAAGAGESRGKCCRRPIGFGETATNYDANGAGTCYDPRYQGCCAAYIGADADHSQTAQAAYSTVFDLRTEQCCKLPVVDNTANGGAQKEKYVIGSSEVCPCLADLDCPTANYTCCAPSQTQVQDSVTNGRRLVQCVGAAGAPTGTYGGMTTGGARFPGCYGKCVPSGTALGTTYYTAKVCLNSLPTFVDQCKDLRMEDTSAFNLGTGALTGIQWRTPRVDELIQTEWSWHAQDCCKSDNGYSVLYKPADSICCPVIGSAPATGAQNGVDFPRRLTPVVPRYPGSILPDDAITGNTPASWSGCLCSTNSDCQGGFVCCENGNSWVTGGLSWQLANQLIYNRPDGTVFNGICINPNTTECCKLDRANPDTVPLSGTRAATAVPYNPNTGVCCAFGGQQASLGDCGCHTNADCPGEFGACCTANSTQFGSGVHAAGKCYDTRYTKCCQYHTLPGSSEPLSSAVFSFATVYDDKERVCCPWGGPQTNLQGCACRSDHPSDDCGAKFKCCAGMAATKIANNTAYRTKGVCYDPSVGHGCCQSSSIVPAFTTASVYDTARQVCCAVNGRQADHRACRCSADNHCPANGECCIDAEWKAAGAWIDCNDVNNAAYCPGRCIHKEIETCCDKPYTSEWRGGSKVGTCVKDYQKCCDGECCNKATQTCKKTTLNRNSLTGVTLNSVVGAVNVAGGAVIPGYHYGLDEDSKACTVWEHSSPSIVFHTWVFPAFLSVASIIVILLGSRAGMTADVGSNLNRMVLVGLQVFVAIMSILLLWSPLWKYGFGIIFANSFILHSFVVGGQWTRRIAVILLVVTFLWVYEPFGTNVILSFGTVTFRNSEGGQGNSMGQSIHGLNYAARALQRARGDTSGDDACTEFYMYWKTDIGLHDARTWNPQGSTRGICRRSWMHTIVVLAGLITPFEAVWLFLAAVALARASQATKDVKVQPIQA